MHISIGVNFNRIDSHTIGVSWSVTNLKTVSGFIGYLYHNDTFLDSKSFDGSSRGAQVINAKMGVVYTVTIKANYTDGTSATGQQDVWTSY